MRELLKAIWLFPWRVLCILEPAWLYLTKKVPLFAIHIYDEADDRYIYDQTIYYTDKGFRIAKKNTKPTSKETVVEHAAVCTSYCRHCNHKSVMWLRDNKTLSEVPIIAINKP